MSLKLLVFSGLLLGLAATPTAGSDPVSGDRRPADRDAIRAHIEQIFQAYMKKDRKTVRATHSADWRGFNPGWHLDSGK